MAYGWSFTLPVIFHISLKLVHGFLLFGCIGCVPLNGWTVFFFTSMGMFHITLDLMDEFFLGMGSFTLVSYMLEPDAHVSH
jgi:hypothetical protein